MENDTTLSSRSLFHYTEKANLKGILRDGFRPRYSLEKMHFFEDIPESPKEAYIPMVSFCDIPKELSANHRKLYGLYAIAMSKEWAINEIGVNPIIYIKENSLLHSYFKGLGKAIYGLNQFTIPNALALAEQKDNDYHFKSYSTTLTEQISYFLRLRPNFLEIMRCVKPYIGFYERKNYKNSNHKFYDEREWRYVPPIRNKDGSMEIIPGLDAEKVASEDILRLFDKEIKPIEFDLEDIDYIIVQTKSEVEEFKGYLNELGNDKSKSYLNSIEIIDMPI